MATASDPNELLLRWQDLRRDGQSPTPEELCAGCPDQVEELRRRIVALQSMEAMLGVGERTADWDEVPDLPGYESPTLIDRGGMGVVYKARHSATGRTVAIKMILAGAQAGARQRARFRAEAETIARRLGIGRTSVRRILAAG